MSWEECRGRAGRCARHTAPLDKRPPSPALHMAQHMGVEWAKDEVVFKLLALPLEATQSVSADLTVYSEIDSLELQKQKCKNRLLGAGPCGVHCKAHGGPGSGLWLQAEQQRGGNLCIEFVKVVLKSK